MVLKAAKMRNARPFLIAVMAALIATLAAATSGGGWASAQDNGTDGTGGTGTDGTPTAEPTAEPDSETPEGQLVRRGLSGKVVRKGESSFVVHTRFGNVHVLVNERTEIYMPPDGQVRFDALEIGDKVGVLLAKPENDDTSAADASEAGDDPVIRTATALKVLIVPDRATRRHIRAMVLEKVRGRLTVIDQNGDEQEIETEADVDSEAGDELLLVTQDGAEGRGARLRTFVLPHVLEARLDRIEERRDDLKDRLDEVRERNAEVRAEVIDRVKERLADVDVAPEVKQRVREAADEIKTRLEDRAEKAREALQERKECREAALSARDEACVKDERTNDERKATPEASKETTDDRAAIGDDKAEANADQVRR